MSPVAPKDARIAELEGEVAELKKLVTVLLAENASLRAEVAELRGRLGQNSTNSSKPPSSDPPGTQRPSKPASGRRPGGQPGHKHHKRKLVPAEQVHRTLDIPAPRRCSQCEQVVAGRAVETLRHQTVEVEPIKPHVTEYRCHGKECGGCGAVSYGELPAEVAGHSFGGRRHRSLGTLPHLFQPGQRGGQGTAGRGLHRLSHHRSLERV